MRRSCLLRLSALEEEALELSEEESRRFFFFFLVCSLLDLEPIFGSDGACVIFTVICGSLGARPGRTAAGCMPRTLFSPSSAPQPSQCQEEQS